MNLKSLIEIKSNKPRGMQESVDDSITRIRTYTIPILNKIGYNADFVQGKYIHEMQPVSKFEINSLFYKRFLLDGCGELLQIYPKKDLRNFLLFQCFVRENIRDIANYPHFNLTHDLVEKIPEKDRIKIMWYILDLFKIGFIIQTKTNKHWIGFYSDIPIEGYALTYRNDKLWKDRLYIIPQYQLRNFRGIRDFESDLQRMFKNK